MRSQAPCEIWPRASDSKSDTESALSNSALVWLRALPADTTPNAESRTLLRLVAISDLAGVIQDHLPPLACLVEQQSKDARRLSACVRRTVQVELTDHRSVIRPEHPHLNIG